MFPSQSTDSASNLKNISRCFSVWTIGSQRALLLRFASSSCFYVAQRFRQVTTIYRFYVEDAGFRFWISISLINKGFRITCESGYCRDLLLETTFDDVQSFLNIFVGSFRLFFTATWPLLHLVIFQSFKIWKKKKTAENEPFYQKIGCIKSHHCPSWGGLFCNQDPDSCQWSCKKKCNVGSRFDQSSCIHSSFNLFIFFNLALINLLMDIFPMQTSQDLLKGWFPCWKRDHPLGHDHWCQIGPQ